MDGFADAERNRDQIDNQRTPQPQGDGDRHAVFDQLQDRRAAKKAVAKIEAQIVAEHFQVAFVERFIKAVAVGDFGNHFRIEPAAAAIMTFADVADAGPGMAGGHTAFSGAR